MILFADLHLREETEAVVFDEVLPGIEKLMAALGENELAFLGDWYHLRYKVSVRIQNRVREWLWRVAGLKGPWWVTLLPGNHDQINERGQHALAVFDDIPNVRVFTEPTWTPHGLWIPYRKDPEEIRAALQTAPAFPDTPPPVVFMHHGVRGAMLNDGAKDLDGLPPEWFAQRTVLCGHYHKPQDIDLPGGRLHYIGSPYQVNANEAGQDKRVALWAGHALQPVPVQWGKRYHTVKTLDRGAARGAQTTEEILARAHEVGVQPRDELVIRTREDPAEVGKLFAAAGYTNVRVIPEIEELQARLDVSATAGVDEYARAYVAAQETTFDKEELSEIYVWLCGQLRGAA